MARETWVQSLIESYQRLKNWHLMPPCLTLRIIMYGSRVKWSNPGKGEAPFPTSRCSSYWKERLRVTFDYGHELYLFSSCLFWRLPSWGKEDAVIFHLFIMYWLYTSMQHRSSMSSNILVLHISACISSRPGVFLFSIFLSNTSRSSCVNYLRLTSSGLLIIFMKGSSVILRNLPMLFLHVYSFVLAGSF